MRYSIRPPRQSAVKRSLFKSRTLYNGGGRTTPSPRGRTNGLSLKPRSVGVTERLKRMHGVARYDVAREMGGAARTRSVFDHLRAVASGQEDFDDGNPKDPLHWKIRSCKLTIETQSKATLQGRCALFSH
jgi:hypothetical protein